MTRSGRQTSATVAPPVDVEAFNNVDNGADWIIEAHKPYMVDVEITGTSKLLFDAWNAAAMQEVKDSRKGAKIGKMDPEAILEQKCIKTDEGHLGWHGIALHRAVQMAAKNRKDPRSPRKSAFELYKTAVIPLTEVIDFGKSRWDFVDVRRALNQFTRGAQNVERPGLREGWKGQCRFHVLLPEYVTPQEFHEVIRDAGMFVGIGAFRPTFGRFMVSKFALVTEGDED